MLSCVVQIVGVRSIAGVQWQDGRAETGLSAPALVPAHDANEHELLPNDYVIEKNTAMPGVCVGGGELSCECACVRACACVCVCVCVCVCWGGGHDALTDPDDPPAPTVTQICDDPALDDGSMPALEGHEGVCVGGGGGGVVTGVTGVLQAPAQH